MKHVRVWKPEIKTVQQGKKLVKVVAKRKGELIDPVRGILDNEFQAQEVGGDDHIILTGRYLEKISKAEAEKQTKREADRAKKVQKGESVEAEDELEKLIQENNREQLNQKAEDLGIEAPEKMKGKKDVAEAIIAASEDNE